MKYLNVLILFTILIACKNDKETKVLKRHTPSQNIKQKIKSKKAQNLYDEGWNYSQQGAYVLAKSSFNKSLEIEKSPLTYNELGVIEFVNKNYRKAIEYYSQGRDLDLLYWPIYINEARSYIKLSEFKNGENILLKLKEICNSEYWIAYADFNLCIIYFNDKRSCDKAYEYLEKSESLASDPDLKYDYQKVKDHLEKKCS